MIEIDDAGGGSFYGGLIIFITNGSKDYWEEVDINLFQILNEKSRNKEIATEAEKITEKAFKVLNVSKTEEIQICPGSYLKGARNYLSKKGYKYKKTKITGRTQDKVELIFGNLLSQKYNIPEYYPNDQIKNHSYQKSILEKRSDFYNVKQFWKPVKKLMGEINAPLPQINNT